MLKEGKFGVTEAVCLVTITCTVKVFFTSPTVLVRHVGTAAWYTTIISAATALIGFAFVYQLLKRFPGKNLPEIYDLSMGRAVGIVFSVLTAALFMADAGVFMREYSEVLRAYTYQETSTSSLVGALLIVTGLAAWQGLESIARLSKLAAYFLLAGYMVLLAFASREYHYDNIFPILGYGLDKSFFIGVQRCSVYAEVVVLAVVAASLQGLKNIKRAGVISIILSGLLIALGLLAQVLLFSYTAGRENSAPLYALARVIKYGEFFSRLDPIFIILWSMATMITVSVLFYTAVSLFCKTFRLLDTRPVIIPMIILLFVLAMVPRDFYTIVYGLIENARRFNWVIFFGLPLAALVTAVLRNKKDVSGNG
jgi:spore germination protein (amino acid permease)